jgi:hypothetical protein
MARRRPDQNRPPTSGTRDRAARVAQAVEALRAFHALGVRSREGGRRAEEEAADRGVNPDRVRKARQFAHPDDGYDAAALEKLCRAVAGQQGQASGGVFGVTHVIRLLGVGDRRLRHRLQTSAVKEGWSLRRLEAAIRQQQGATREGGRRPQVAADAAGVCDQLEKLCERWRRLAAALQSEPDGGGAVLDELPEPLARQFGQVTRKVADFHRAVTAELGQLQPKRQARRQFRDEEGGKG